MKKGVFEIRDDFYLDGKPFKIISGAVHYFRIVPEYWRDRLEKLKAMGANTVETYVPWNKMCIRDRYIDPPERENAAGRQAGRGNIRCIGLLWTLTFLHTAAIDCCNDNCIISSCGVRCPE